MAKYDLMNQIDINKISVLKNWQASSSLEAVLLAIFKEMSTAANKKLPQPAEGEMY